MPSPWFDQSLLQDNIDAQTSYVASRQSTRAQSEAILTALRDVWPDDLDRLDVLKAARQRRVLRMETANESVILKLFPLASPISRLRHKKYARREFLNYHEAAARGIRTPLCHGFIEQRKLGFVACSGVVIEDLGDAQDAVQLGASTSYVEASHQCIPALVALFHAGVNHIDARDENILLRPGGWRIIDWQYAKFVTPKAEWLLEHLTAYYIANAPAGERATLQGAWMSAMHAASGAAGSVDDFKMRVCALLSRHQGTRARFALRPA